jgi:ketosteroid isomerase-like protein
MVMPPDGDIIASRKGIEAALKDLLAKNALELAFWSIRSTGSPSLGFEVGMFELTVKPGEGAAKRSRCKCLAILTPDGEGHWRVAH